MSFLKIYSKRISIALIVITLCYVIIYLNYSPQVNDQDQKARFIQIKETIKNKSSSVACKQPFLPLNSSDVLKFIKNTPRIDCSATVDWVQCTGSECSIKEEINFEKGPIRCSFVDVLRKDDFHLYEGETTNSDSYFQLEKSDNVNVHCKSSHDQWSSVLTGIRLNKSIWDRSGWQYVPKNNLMLNVLMLGFDSLSRNAFIRKLPFTYQYLIKHLKGHVLEGYNIVGDGTPQALTPILTGKTELELPDVRRRFAGTETVDVYPFIWKDYQENGYVTAFLEDMPFTGIYQYRLNGFKKPPTDHYMRPYYLAISKSIKKWPELCVGETPRHKIMLNHIEHFYAVYKTKPKFLFGFHGELSHDDYNLIGAADEDLMDFLKNLEKNGVFNNTILILMSDHGHRFAKIRNTMQGKQEERLPFFSFSFPSWFKSKHQRIYDNFVSNLQTLTTPFDIYSTLKDILNFESPDVANLENRSVSLFSKIPKQRSCSLANIEPHWCACLDWENVDLKSPIVQRLAATFINTVNGYTYKHSDICARLRIVQVEWVTKLKPNEQLAKFRKSADIDGFVADLTGNTPVPSHTYEIKVMVMPGDSLFEASITHYLKDDRLDLNLSDISRINQYGKQARCVEANYPHLRKYCYCLVD